jgi:glycosyltransferase involved in cell wall biosynthesis
MNKTKLSVCIPVYNGENYIEQTIDSVLSQSFTDFELIIVDNRSTDKTVARIQRYNDARIRLIQNQSNIGLIPNWNKAIENATGEYIKILPADDYIYPECLKVQCSILDMDTEHKISMVCARRNIIDETGKIIINRGFSRKEINISGFDAINKNVRSGGNIIGEGASVMFRKKILEKTGVFNSDIFYVLDIDLWYKILLLGNLYALPQTLATFRVSNSSASVKIADKQREEYAAFIKKIYADKKYKLSWLSLQIGLFKNALLTEGKKILYKYKIK